MKRTGIKRGKPLARGAPLARTGSLKRTGRLPAQSARRRQEKAARAAVREQALAAAGYQCTARSLVPEVRCAGGLEVDEITPRGVRPGAHLEPDQTQVLCHAHHEWKTTHPAEAHALGLRRWSWETPA